MPSINAAPLDIAALPLVLFYGRQKRLLMRSPAQYYPVTVPTLTNSGHTGPADQVGAAASGLTTDDAKGASSGLSRAASFTSQLDLSSATTTATADAVATPPKAVSPPMRTAPLLIADGTCCRAVPADALAAVLGDRHFLGIFSIAFGKATIIGHPIVFANDAAPNQDNVSAAAATLTAPTPTRRVGSFQGAAIVTGAVDSPAANTSRGVVAGTQLASFTAHQQAAYAFILVVVPEGCSAPKESIAAALTTFTMALQHVEHHDSYVTVQAEALAKIWALRSPEAEWASLVRPKGPKLVHDLEAFGTALVTLATTGAFPRAAFHVAGAIQVSLHGRFNTRPPPGASEAPQNVDAATAPLKVGLTLPIVPSGHAVVAATYNRAELLRALQAADVLVPTAQDVMACALSDVFAKIDELVASLADGSFNTGPGASAGAAAAPLSRTYPTTAHPSSSGAAAVPTQQQLRSTAMTLDRLVPTATVYAVLQDTAKRRLESIIDADADAETKAVIIADAARGALSILIDAKVVTPRAETHVAFFPSAVFHRDGAPPLPCPFGTPATCGCGRAATVASSDATQGGDHLLSQAWLRIIASATSTSDEPSRGGVQECQSICPAFTAKGSWRGTLQQWPFTVVEADVLLPTTTAQSSAVGDGSAGSASSQPNSPLDLHCTAKVPHINAWWKRVESAAVQHWQQAAALTSLESHSQLTAQQLTAAARFMAELTAYLAVTVAAAPGGTLRLSDCQSHIAERARVSRWEGSLVLHAILAHAGMVLRTVTRPVAQQGPR